MDAAEVEKVAKSPAEINAAEAEKAAKLRAHRDAARRRRENYMRRAGLLAPPGSVFLDRTNCNNFDIDGFLGLNRAVGKEEFLAVEEIVWNAAMAYLKSNDNDHAYDLIPQKMTPYPVVFDNHIWHHCNIMGKRINCSPSSPPTIFFVELKLGTCYEVMACIPIGLKNRCICKACPASCAIVHPSREEFVCGSRDGQKLFHYSIPGEPLSLGPCHGGANTLPSTGTQIPKTAVSP